MLTFSAVLLLMYSISKDRDEVPIEILAVTGMLDVVIVMMVVLALTGEL